MCLSVSLSLSLSPPPSLPLQSSVPRTTLFCFLIEDVRSTTALEIPDFTTCFVIKVSQFKKQKWWVGKQWPTCPVHAPTCSCTCTYTHVHVHVPTCSCTCPCRRLRVCTRSYTCTCVYVQVYAVDQTSYSQCGRKQDYTNMYMYVGVDRCKNIYIIYSHKICNFLIIII